jgi:hypothetical protein
MTPSQIKAIVVKIALQIGFTMAKTVNESIPAPQMQSPPARWPGWLALLLFCFAGACIGFFTTKPLYRAHGLIRLRQPPRILHDEPAPPIDRSLLEQETYFIRSRLIAEMAEQNRAWIALGRPINPASTDSFWHRLDAQLVAGGLIQISFLDEDPNVAAAGAKAAVFSYSEISASNATKEAERRMLILREETNHLDRSVAASDAEILDLWRPFGTPNLAALHDMQIQEAFRLEQQLLDADALPASTTPKAIASTRTAPDALSQHYEKIKRDAGVTALAMTRIDEVRRQRADLANRRAAAQNRFNEFNFEERMPGPLSILSVNDTPLTPAIDHRLRNAAWSALPALILFLIIRSIWRHWRTRYRVVSARTAFPLIITHTPKPVLPISETAQ